MPLAAPFSYHGVEKNAVVPIPAFVLLLALSGCTSSVPAGSSPSPIIADTSVIRRALAPEHTFVTIVEKDTIRLENIVRIPGQFASDVLDRRQNAALKIGGEFNSREVITALNVDTWQRTVAGEERHVQHGEFRVTEDSVFGEVRDSASRQSQRFARPPNAMLYQMGILVLAEQVIRRALSLGGRAVTVPLYYYGTTGVTDTARIEFATDRPGGTLTIHERIYTFQLDEFGYISELAGPHFRTVRVPFRELEFH